MGLLGYIPNLDHHGHVHTMLSCAQHVKLDWSLVERVGQPRLSLKATVRKFPAQGGDFVSFVARDVLDDEIASPPVEKSV